MKGPLHPCYPYQSSFSQPRSQEPTWGGTPRMEEEFPDEALPQLRQPSCPLERDGNADKSAVTTSLQQGAADLRPASRGVLVVQAPVAPGTSTGTVPSPPLAVTTDCTRFISSHLPPSSWRSPARHRSWSHRVLGGERYSGLSPAASKTVDPRPAG